MPQASMAANSRNQTQKKVKNFLTINLQMRISKKKIQQLGMHPLTLYFYGRLPDPCTPLPLQLYGQAAQAGKVQEKWGKRRNEDARFLTYPFSRQL